MNKKYKDANIPVDERVEDLLSQMTLDEKLAQLGCVMAAMGFFVGGKEEILKNGIGQISTLCGCFTKEMNADLINATQKYLLENTRLGIPAMFHVETLSGAQSAGAVCYPVPIALGATFEPALVEKMAENIREEMDALRMKCALAPVMDIARDPRWGRTCETYGENATLASAMSVAYVKGLQGADLAEGVAATAKHFVGYAMGEAGMNIAGAHMGQREIREIYVKPFEAAIRLANLECVMNAYHVIDNVPIAAGKEYLRDLLRGELGFEGLTISDYGSIDKLYDVYHIAADYTEAGILALEAGIDTETPQRVCYTDGMKKAAEEGKLDIAFIDNAVRRLLSLKFRLGLFENPYSDLARMNAVYQNKSAVENAYRLAAKSIVLLKNENNLLPLAPDNYKKVAVIGPNADDLRAMFGGYSLVGVLEMLLLNMQGHSQAAEGIEMSDEMKTQAAAITSRLPSPEMVMRMNYPGIMTVADALREVFAGAEVSTVRGCDFLGTDKSGFEMAVKAASESDIVILVVGGKNGSGAGCTMGENVDASNVGLPGVQEDLIKTVFAANQKLVVVHMDGRPLSSVWTAENVPAIIEAWHPGQCGAKAIAEVLTGKYNPGGKLAITAVRDVGQIPIYADQLRGSGTTGRGLTNSKIESGYVDKTGKPLYSFGHGLSYTTFVLSDLEISKRTVEPLDNVVIFVSVTNTGGTYGEEVVQLYYSDICTSMVRPAQDLVGFIRVGLNPGETKCVKFTVKASQFAFLDKDMRWKVEKGEIEVRAGISSVDIKLTGSFEISNDYYLPTSERGYYAEVEIL